MPWSKAVLKREEADTQVLEYKPSKFELGIPSQALDYLKAKSIGSDFRMSDVIRKQTGVEELELQSDEKRIEDRALEKLKEIQENAYQEGFNLGLDEGRKKAFEESARHIEQNLAELSQTIQSISNIKKEILNHNEAHMVQLLFHMASKLAQSHLEYDHAPIVDIIKQAVSLAQGEESVTVHVSSRQIEFLENLKAQQKVELDFLDHVKLVANDDMTPGGCIVETNYGEVDASLEQRIQQLWKNLEENMPRVKPKLVG